MNEPRFADVVLRGGHRRLTLAVAPGERALLLDGRPVSLTWGDVMGRRWLLRAGDLGTLDDRTLTVDLAATTSLTAAVRPLLALLPDGPVRLTEVEEDDLPVDAAITPRPHELAWLGLAEVGDGPLLVSTVPAQRIPPRRVAGLVDAIGRGRRPAAVALSLQDDDYAFVVAGHAAVEAWRRVGRTPPLVLVELRAAHQLEQRDTADLIERGFAQVGAAVAEQYADRHLLEEPSTSHG